jgi:hypothetical protein
VAEGGHSDFDEKVISSSLWGGSLLDLVGFANRVISYNKRTMGGRCTLNYLTSIDWGTPSIPIFDIIDWL